MLIFLFVETDFVFHPLHRADFFIPFDFVHFLFVKLLSLISYWARCSPVTLIYIEAADQAICPSLENGRVGRRNAPETFFFSDRVYKLLLILLTTNNRILLHLHRWSAAPILGFFFFGKFDVPGWHIISPRVEIDNCDELRHSIMWRLVRDVKADRNWLFGEYFKRLVI